MQQRQLYAILDNKANEIVAGLITVHRNVATALRQHSDALSNPQSELGKHPDDYDLICLGNLVEEDEGLPALDPKNGGELVMTGKAAKRMLDAANNAGPQLVKES